MSVLLLIECIETPCSVISAVIPFLVQPFRQYDDMTYLVLSIYMITVQ